MDRIDEFFEQVKLIANSLNRIANSLERLENKIDVNAVSSNSSNINITNKEAILEKVNKESELKSETEILEKFLTNKNLYLEQLPEQMDFDELFDKAAYYIGNKYELTKPLVDSLKISASQGKDFELQIGNYSQIAIGNMCQLCNYLYKNNLLEEYHYKKSPKYIIKAKPIFQGHVQNLFTGKWLERYIFQIVKNTVGSHFNNDIEYHIFRNIRVKSENSGEFELDILLLIDKYYYWFECKTGKYQQYLERYSNFAKVRGFNKKHTFMVSLKADKNTCDNLSSNYNISVVNVLNFQQAFQKQLEIDINNQTKG